MIRIKVKDYLATGTLFAFEFEGDGKEAIDWFKKIKLTKTNINGIKAYGEMHSIQVVINKDSRAEKISMILNIRLKDRRRINKLVEAVIQVMDCTEVRADVD